MKLISDIVNELMDYSAPISGALLKTKVLAKRISNEPLQMWVNGELNGYDQDADLPEYRMENGVPTGVYLNGRMQYTGAISTVHLTKDELDELTIITMRDSISTVEKLIQTKGLKINPGSHKRFYLERSIINLGNPYFQILSLNLEIPATFLTNILAIVRSKLLEFMLEIESQFGQETEIEDLKAKKVQVSTIVNHTINNSGHGAIITSGSENKVSGNTNISIGNKEVLKEVLKKHFVEEEDLQELISFIDQEPATVIDHYSPKVNDWIKKMMTKAIEGTWQVGIGAAGGVIAEALARYYGLN